MNRGVAALERKRMSRAQLQPLIEAMRARKAQMPAKLAEVRAEFATYTAVWPFPEGVSRQNLSAGGRPAAWFLPRECSPRRVILYLHGGGYCIGSIETHAAMMARIALAAQARLLAIDYRLAPEHPHPAAVQDAVAAYEWLLAEGHDPTDIGIAGDSAGGGLTIAAMVALRDRGISLPAAGVCISPWVDLEGLGDSMSTRAAEDPMIDRAGVLQFARLFLNGADARDPLAAPLHARLAGLPPLLIQVGTAETLLDDATRITARARMAGVDVSLEIYDGMVHVWHMFVPAVDEAATAIRSLGAYLRRRIP